MEPKLNAVNNTLTLMIIQLVQALEFNVLQKKIVS